MPKGFSQPDWLHAAAQEAPDALALIEDERTHTYGELDAQVTLMASRFSAAGIERGQHVGLLLPNSTAYVTCIWALWRLGATPVLLNTRLTPAERADQIARARCALVLDEALLATLPPAATGQSEPVEFTRQALAVIVFTSGTSGRPKGAQITFNNLHYAAMASTLRLGNVPEDRWLLTLPLYHVGGLSMIVRACLCRVPLIVLQRFDPQIVTEAIERHRATLISLVPTMLRRLLDSGAVPHPPWVRLILIGGAAAAPALIEDALGRGLPVAPTYGLTEAGSQVCTALPDEARRKPGSVGRPLPFMRVRIVDEQGDSVPTGELGEIVVQGPNVMFGYLGETPAGIPLTQWGTPAYLPYQQGYPTGDMGYLDEDGDLYVVQRRTDLIVTGGENVYPAEIERVLLAHPAVREAAVVGIPSVEWGQQVAAVITLVKHDDSRALREDLERHLRAQLAGYKIPRVWQVVDALPLTASGKVDRAQVRALAVPDP